MKQILQKRRKSKPRFQVNFRTSLMVITTCSDWDFTDTVRFQNALLGLAQCQFTEDASPDLNYTDLAESSLTSASPSDICRWLSSLCSG